MILVAKFLTALSLLFVSLPFHPASASTHPHNAAGFVTDGSPQDDDAHCVGPNPGRFACLVARHPGLVAFLQSQWDSTHVRIASIPRNSIEACIVDHESGNSYWPNPPGNGGQRYQFLYSTWTAYGGDPNTWSHASPAEQDSVFMTAVARNGYSDWRQYDGC